MNLYEIVNTETGEIVLSGVSYLEAQRYMQANSLNKANHEINLHMPVRRKAFVNPKLETIKEIIADAHEISSNSTSPFVKVAFKNPETAAIRKAQFEKIGVEVETCGNRSWLKYIF